MDDLTKLDGVPLYVKIRQSLRENILNGSYKRGEKIPSEEELSAQYGVSRMTLRHSINDLIDEGLLYRRQGVGTFVAHHHLARDHSRLTNFFENSRMDGLQVSEKVLDFRQIPAKYQVAKALNLKEADPVICIKTLRFIETEPITVHEAYIPMALFGDLLNMDIESQSQDLWGFYERCGYKVKRGVQRLEARQADEDLAELLSMQVGAPILYKERTLFSEDGTPIEFLYCFNRGDMYSITVSLLR